MIVETAELIEALSIFSKKAQLAVKLNDADNIEGNAVRAHKIMMALSGYIHGYDAEIDKARSIYGKSEGVK